MRLKPTWATVLCIALCVCAGAGWALGLPGGSSRVFKFFFSVNGFRAGERFAEPNAVALNERSGLIYIADTKSGFVDAISVQGIPKFQYGPQDGIKAPLSVLVDKQGDVFVSENDGGPVKIVDSKARISTLELVPGEKQDPPKPGRMTVDRDGNIFVVDRANNQIYSFDRNRKFRFKFGSSGDREGQFKMLQDVATDGQCRIYALDSMGTPVQVFDRMGKYMYRFGVIGDRAEQLSLPASMVIDRNDQIWVVDRLQHALKLFDRSGTFLRSFGAFGQGEGSFFHPIDAAIDSLGRVYVIEIGSRRLQVFSTGNGLVPFSPTAF